jgi:hypothetical protein
MNITDTQRQLTETLVTRGYSLESGNLRGEVKGDQGHDWPCITFDCVVKKNDKIVWTGFYSMGVGHVKIPKTPRVPWMMPNELEATLFTLQKHPYAQLKNKSLHAKLAAWLAREKEQNVKPLLPDVLNSILSDGSAYFDAETFEDWCSNFGYDSDSIKAKKMYDVCDETGRKMVQALGKQEIDELREMLQDY